MKLWKFYIVVFALSWVVLWGLMVTIAIGFASAWSLALQLVAYAS